MSAILLTPSTSPGNSNYDPYYSNVSLILSMNGSNNSTSFVDASPNQKTVTANGNAQISTTQWKFGGSSAYFDGTGDYLTLPTGQEFNFGTGDFTIECWVYVTNFTTERSIMYKFVTWSTNVDFALRIDASTGIVRFIGGDSGLISITSNSAIGINQWVHIAVARSSGTTRMFINGVAQTSTSTGNHLIPNDATTLYIGTDGTDQSVFYLGYIDDLRITKGVARYTSNFTVPAYANPLTGPQYDPFYNNVSLLLHCNGSNASTNFIDNSGSPKTVTANGTAQISTAQWKFNGSSAYFAGNLSPGWLSIPSDSAFTFGTGDFTIEAWVYLASGTAGTIFDNRTSTTSLHPVIILANGGVGANDRISFYVAGSYPIISGVVPLTGTWTHVALCKSSGSTRLFINGVQSGSTYSDSNNYAASGTVLAGAGLGGANQLNGYIDDLRITKGVARYTTNFTPPKLAFADSGPNFDPYYDQVTLLLPFNGANASLNITDYSKTSKTFQEINATLSTTQSKFGGSSVTFTGAAGSYLRLAVSTDFEFESNDFTIECWARPVSFGNGFTLYSHWGGQSGLARFIISLTSTGFTVNTTNGLALTFSGTTTISLNQWVHCALTRQGSNFRTFANGVIVSTATSTSSYVPSGGLMPVYIGQSDGTATGYGFIDDLRVTKGVARYTDNFAVPVRPNPITGIKYDNYYDNVSLLLHMNGPNNGTSFIDNSLRAKTVTANGNAVTSTTQYRYGGSSALFDGSGDRLTISNGPDFEFGSGDFTLEAWFYVLSFPGYGGAILGDQNLLNSTGGPVYIKLGGTTGSIEFGVRATELSFTTLTASSVISVNTWHHVAAVRNATSWYFFVDGILRDSRTGQPSSATMLANTNNQPFRIGALTYGSGTGDGVAADYHFHGYIDDVRITKGIARYTANFTLPTQAFPDQGPDSDPYYYNTVLLLKFMGPPGNNGIIDSSPIPKAIKVNGNNTAITNSFYKFNGASCAFDGTGDELEFTPTNDFLFPQNFTIEAWVYFTSITGVRSIFGAGPSGSLYFDVRWNGNEPRWEITLNSGFGTSIGATPAPTINTWIHVAWVRNLNSIKLYVNGVATETTISNSAQLGFSNLAFTVGGTGPGTNNFSGYIDELRVTKNVARYVNNFTPPQRPFPDQ